MSQKVEFDVEYSKPLDCQDKHQSYSGNLHHKWGWYRHYMGSAVEAVDEAGVEAGKDCTHYTQVDRIGRWVHQCRDRTSFEAAGVEAAATPTELDVEAVEASLLHLPVADGQRRWVEAGPKSSFVGAGLVGRCRKVEGPWG